MEKNLMLDISNITKKLLINDPFYGLFLSSIGKQECRDIPLAAVSINKSTMDFTLLINPDEWFKYSNEVKYGVIKHEALHLTNFHLLLSDVYPNPKMANVAMDCEINQYINKENLPSWGIFIENLAKEHPNLDWRKQAGAKHYYDQLSKLSEEQKSKMGISENAKHFWTIIDGEGNEVELNDSEKEALKTQIEHTIESIAEEVAKSQGSLPSEIDMLIKGFVKPKPKFSYKKFIRNYVGNSTRYTIGSTKLRENQRFPGQPKIVLKPVSKILVLIDQSGSVSEKELYEFLNEIYHMQKNVDLEIRAFDMSVSDVIRYKGNNEFKRVYCGGTSFTAAVEYYKESHYNSCIIFTDGHAEVPPKTVKRLLWVISSNGTTDSIKNHAPFIKIPNE